MEKRKVYICFENTENLTARRSAKNDVRQTTKGLTGKQSADKWANPSMFLSVTLWYCLRRRNNTLQVVTNFIPHNLIFLTHASQSGISIGTAGLLCQVLDCVLPLLVFRQLCYRQFLWDELNWSVMGVYSWRFLVFISSYLRSNAKIWSQLLLISNKKSYVSFRVAPTSVTLNYFERQFWNIL